MLATLPSMAAGGQEHASLLFGYKNTPILTSLASEPEPP